MAGPARTLFDKVWDRPFDTPRQMTLYGVIQEMATFVIYIKQRERALTELEKIVNKELSASMSRP